MKIFLMTLLCLQLTSESIYSALIWQMPTDSLIRMGTNDNKYAQVLLSARFRYGKYGDSVNFEKANMWLNMAMFGDTTGLALYEKGKALKEGKGFTKDTIMSKRLISEAFLSFTKSVETGYAPIQHAIANCYHYGYGITIDNVKAVQYYKLAADQGLPESRYNLAFMLLNGIGIDRNANEAFTLFNNAADQNIPEAQHMLSICYLKGYGTAIDTSQAFKWLQKAANNGLPNDQQTLGDFYFSGITSPQNYEKAFYWYKKAAENGSKIGMFKLARCYQKGFGVEDNIINAITWYLNAAEQGDSVSQFTIGAFYENGEGVEKDSQIAFKWYLKAAENGFPRAQYKIANCYLNGYGTEEDSKKAVEFFKKAALQGDTASQFILGNCYSEGIGVQRNLMEAIKWYRKAAEQGHSSAKSELNLCLVISQPTKSLPTSIKIKEFYIGMSITDVLDLINLKYVDIFGFCKLQIYNGNIKNAKHEIITNTKSQFVFDSKNILIKIYLPKEVVDILFNVADLDAAKFAQEFVNSYNIPEMKAHTETNNIGLASTAIAFWEYTTRDGVNVRITGVSEAVVLGFPVSIGGKDIIIEKIPTKSERSFD